MPTEPVATRLFVVATVTGAATAVVLLVAGGARAPGPVPFVALAIVVGLAVNRVTVFVPELSATAESAAVLAAVVGFHGRSPLLGPLLVGALAGPLDVFHWRHRSLLRMGYNAASQGLAALAAAAVFGAAGGSAGVGPASRAVVPALLAYAAADSLLGLALLSVRGERPASAVRHQLSVNGPAVLLGAYGAGCGLLALHGGWGPAFAALLPTPLVPELVLVRLPRRWRTIDRVALIGALGVVVGLAALAAWFPLPAAGTLGFLVIAAVLAGTESASAASTPPPLLALPVAAALVVVPGRGVLFAAAVAASVTVLIPAARARSLPRHLPAAAAAAPAVAAGAWWLRDLTVDGAVVTAAVGAMVLVVVLTRRLAPAVWMTPLVGASALLGGLWRRWDPPGAVVAIAATAVTVAAAVAWGAPPWRSRVLSARLADTPAPSRRGAFAIAAVVAVAASGALAVSPPARDVLVLVAAAGAQADLAMAMLAVRQWRFAPRARVRGAAMLFVGSLSVVLALRATPAAVVAIVVGAVVASALAAWRLAGLGAPSSADPSADAGEPEGFGVEGVGRLEPIGSVEALEPSAEDDHDAIADLEG
jgi:hypothetical protein